jgi:NitT/TauT family transport system permease protein
MTISQRLHLHVLPVGSVLLVALILWYVLAFALNASGVIDRVLTPRGP